MTPTNNPQTTPQRRIPASPVAASKPQKRSRSRFSTLINLLVLIALFTAVFALQRVGKDSTQDTGDKSPPETELATKAPETPKAGETTKAKEPAPKPTEPAAIELPTQPKPLAAYAPEPQADETLAGIQGAEDSREEAAV